MWRLSMADKQMLSLRSKILGAIMKKARTAAGKSLSEMSALIGETSGSLSSMERGSRAISLPQLEIFAYHLNIPLGRFLGDDETPVEEKDLNPKIVVALRQRMIGALLRTHRTEAGLSMRELAEMSGLPSRRISSYEQGERPIPLPELEALAASLGRQTEDYIDVEGPVGEWRSRRQAFEAFLDLPVELREFLSEPTNQPYLDLARNLSAVSIDRLRALGQGLLDITL
jgi:transcriptional regulator with XRE-family HTH domain